jgi:hypothetical protein
VITDDIRGAHAARVALDNARGGRGRSDRRAARSLWFSCPVHGWLSARRGSGPPRVMRIVEGVRGRVPMRMELCVRPDYATIRPWVERASDGAVATAGPDAFRISTPLPLQVEDGTVSAEFVAVEGARERLTLRLGAGSHRGVVARVERALPL